MINAHRTSQGLQPRAHAGVPRKTGSIESSSPFPVCSISQIGSTDLPLKPVRNGSIEPSSQLMTRERRP
jgi:hypothetical protein